jgi:hypothetical protein
MIFLLFILVGLLGYATYSIKQTTNAHDKALTDTASELGAVRSRANLALTNSAEAANNASAAMQVARVLASDGALPEPTGEAAEGMSLEERTARDAMKRRKAAEEKNRLAFLSLTQQVTNLSEYVSLLDQAIQTNHVAIAATSNRFERTIHETEKRIVERTDSMITLRLTNAASKSELADAKLTASQIREDLEKSVGGIRNNLDKLSNSLTTAAAPKAKPQKNTTNDVAVKAGDIAQASQQIVLGTISRTGRPVIKKGLFNKKTAVTVQYEVQFTAPNGTNIGVDEAVFQRFESANGGLMVDLAEARNDPKGLAKLSDELTKAMTRHLQKEKIPQGVRFVGAKAKAPPAPTTATP